ncbi:MAG: hypothetical protein AB8I08_01875 [Sandaracinaceae bacterium]
MKAAARLGAVSMLAGWLPATFLSGCFAVSDLDRYSFDDDPCPPVTSECAGGVRYVYTQTAFDFVRPSEGGRLQGFDLDGTDRAVCRQDDFVSPRGDSGVDNQTSALLLSLEEVSGESLSQGIREAQLRGELLSLYVLDNVDSFDNDDCVRIQFLPGRVPQGEEPAGYLDGDGDGTVDSGIRFDFGTATSEDMSACIVDGELRVRISGNQTLLLGPDDPGAVVQRARLRCQASPEALTECLFGGSYSVDSLSDPALIPILQSTADLDFDGRRCQSVSFAMELEAVSAELGEPRI